MTHWKFLASGLRSPFTGHRWRPGEWSVAAAAAECVTGFHACGVADLPYWLGPELWAVELAPPVHRSAHKVVARRARLLEPVAGWTPEVARDLALACVARTAGHAVAELAEAGLAAEASELEGLTATTPPAAWRETADACADASLGRRRRQASRLCGYVVDAIDSLDVYPVASLAYIAARAAGERSSAASEEPYSQERAWQAAWLADRLGLAQAGSRVS